MRSTTQIQTTSYLIARKHSYWGKKRINFLPRGRSFLLIMLLPIHLIVRTQPTQNNLFVNRKLKHSAWLIRLLGPWMRGAVSFTIWASCIQRENSLHIISVGSGNCQNILQHKKGVSLLNSKWIPFLENDISTDFAKIKAEILMPRKAGGGNGGPYLEFPVE